MATQATARPMQRIVVPHRDGDSTIHISLVEGVLTAQQELRDATATLALALRVKVEAAIAETDARRTYDYAELDFRAKRLAAGVPGTNEPTRKINLDLAVMDDEELGELRLVCEMRQETRLRAEADEREADLRHKALRVELAALGQLVGAV